MRAKRSKKYRKIMSAYGVSFSFRPPYQVLLSAAFLRTCHAFHMPLQQFLDNTLHGPCKLLVSQCTFDRVMKEESARVAAVMGRSVDRVRRPDFMPPPTEAPLRYCKHEAKREELGECWTEADCLIDLLSGMPQGNELRKNKWHYVLATADSEELNKESHTNKKHGFQAKKAGNKGDDVRERARLIAGVPVVYVKRSVMVLEEMSGASLNVRNGLEKEKFRDGLVGDRKRKRGEGGEEEDGEEDEENDPLQVETQSEEAKRGMRKPKAPNPLSMLKKKVKKAPAQQGESHSKNQSRDEPVLAGGETSGSKTKRTRKHKRNKGEGNEGPPPELGNVDSS